MWKVGDRVFIDCDFFTGRVKDSGTIAKIHNHPLAREVKLYTIHLDTPSLFPIVDVYESDLKELK